MHRESTNSLPEVRSIIMHIQDICSRTEDDCSLSAENEKALTIISIFGASLSIIGLVLTIVTMLAFKYEILFSDHVSCNIVSVCKYPQKTAKPRCLKVSRTTQSCSAGHATGVFDWF